MGIIEAVFSNPFVAFLILVAAVIFIHELGHYLMGRALGIDVEEFAIGFGPTAVAFKRGGTEYKICWFPLGGYVRFYGAEIGQDIPPEMRERSILTAKLYKRALVSAAGPCSNFILSLAIMIVLSNIGLPQPAAIVSVLPDGAAAQAGMQDGDKLLFLDDTPIESWTTLNTIVSSSANKTLKAIVERNGENVELSITPRTDEMEDPYGEKQKVGRIGVTPVLSSPRFVLGLQHPFYSAGLRSGDKVVSVDGRQTKYFHEVVQAVSGKRSFEFVVERPQASDANGLSEEIKQARKERIEPLKTETIQVSLSSPEWQQTLFLNHISLSDLTIGKMEPPRASDKRAGSFDTLKMCGLNTGDAILAIGETAVRSPVQLAALFRSLQKTANEQKQMTLPLNLRLLSWNGSERAVTCQMTLRKGFDDLNREQLFLDFPLAFLSSGITADPVVVKSNGFVDSIGDGFRHAAEQAETVFTGIRKLVTGQVPLANLGGPIAIAQVAGDAAQGGILIFVLTISWMSINIGMFNLLPLPALDGGHLLLQAVEAAYGKPLPRKVQEGVQRLGIAVILVLFVLVFYNDILRLFRS